MKHALRRLSLLLSQVLFSIITPPLLVPCMAKLRLTRSAIAFFFGRLYGNRYDDIIAAFGDSYAMPMSHAMKLAKEILKQDISVIVDCGTGTGFVTRQAAGAFPSSTIIACDLLENMLRLARDSSAGITARVMYVQADSFSLPLADGCADMVLVQNTMPAFHEFHRILRPGGLVLYVDTSAGWIASLATRLVRRHRLFESVTGERVGMGFYVVAKKAEGNAMQLNTENQVSPDMLLRCPLDKSGLGVHEATMVCAEGHRFPITDGFPVLLPEASISGEGRE
jgi:SAM-dependent methyltransferase